MNKQQIIDKVKSLDLPAGGYIVFGSCPMAAAELREANDIDLLVSESVLERLKREGWQQITKANDDKPYVMDVFEAHTRMGREFV